MKPQHDHEDATEEQDGQAGAQALAGNGGQQEAAQDQAPAQGGMEGAQAQAAQEEAAQLRGELELARRQLAERQDANLRLQAELENFKKRVLKEQAENLRYAQLPLLKELTVAMDNLQRALEHTRKAGTTEATALAEGIELVARQLGAIFERFGMTRVPTEGTPFDPTRHEAVSVVETNEVPENHVLQEFRAGYVLHDRVVRPAMVSVSKRAGGPADGEANVQSQQ